MAGLKWEDCAEEDLAVIIGYIADENPEAALALLNEIEAKADNLLIHPRLYKAGRCPGTRELIVRHNYVIVYTVATTGSVAILRVLHAAQQWPEKE
jgi:addiction module RelE/StbE family toxin